jgi:hypothetical protein
LLAEPIDDIFGAGFGRDFVFLKLATLQHVLDDGLARRVEFEIDIPLGGPSWKEVELAGDTGFRGKLA